MSPLEQGFPWPEGRPSRTRGLRGRGPATGQKGLPRLPVSTLALQKTGLSLTWQHLYFLCNKPKSQTLENTSSRNHFMSHRRGGGRLCCRPRDHRWGWLCSESLMPRARRPLGGQRTVSAKCPPRTEPLTVLQRMPLGFWPSTVLFGAGVEISGGQAVAVRSDFHWELAEHIIIS